jgi:hypothetical protein
VAAIVHAVAKADERPDELPSAWPRSFTQSPQAATFVEPAVPTSGSSALAVAAPSERAKAVAKAALAAFVEPAASFPGPSASEVAQSASARSGRSQADGDATLQAQTQNVRRFLGAEHQSGRALQCDRHLGLLEASQCAGDPGSALFDNSSVVIAPLAKAVVKAAVAAFDGPAESFSGSFALDADSLVAAAYNEPADRASGPFTSATLALEVAQSVVVQLGGEARLAPEKAFGTRAAATHGALVPASGARPDTGHGCDGGGTPRANFAA